MKKKRPKKSRGKMKVKSTAYIVVRGRIIPLKFVTFSKKNKNLLGRAYWDDNDPKDVLPLYIELADDLEGKQLLSTFIHEYLHLIMPKIRENKIQEMESEIISALDVIAKHQKKVKRKQFKVKFGDE